MQPYVWKVKQFLELVREKVSESAASSVASAVRSVPWKLWLAEYHAESVEEVIARLVPADAEPRFWAVVQLLRESAPGDQERPIRLAVFEAEAHTIACAQALHSVIDLFGPIIYTGLGLSESRLEPKKQYPRNVLRALKANGDHASIADCLQSLLDSEAYRYVRAYVNTTKHRSLVPSSYAVSFEVTPPDRVQGLRIAAFEYQGEIFDRRWALVLTEDYRTSIHEAAVRLGINLNAELQSAA